MNVNALQTFLVVVECGSIAQASRLLDLPPTTIAQQMKALHSDIGTPLLARAGRTLQPTMAGTRILEHARSLVKAARDLRSAASSSDLPAGPLLLGATHSALSGLLPPVLKRWSQQHPEIKVFIEPGDSLPLISKVASHALDAAMLVHPGFALPKSCDWITLREEPLILLTPADMPVNDPLQVLASAPYIRFDRRVVGGKLADEYLRAHDIRPHAQFELDGVEEIAKFVSEGLGVALLPDWATVGMPDASVRRWPLPAPRLCRHVGLLWNRTSARLGLVQALQQLLKA